MLCFSYHLNSFTYTPMYFPLDSLAVRKRIKREQGGYPPFSPGRAVSHFANCELVDRTWKKCLGLFQPLVFRCVDQLISAQSKQAGSGSAESNRTPSPLTVDHNFYGNTIASQPFTTVESTARWSSSAKPISGPKDLPDTASAVPLTSSTGWMQHRAAGGTHPSYQKDFAFSSSENEDSEDDANHHFAVVPVDASNSPLADFSQENIGHTRGVGSSASALSNLGIAQNIVSKNRRQNSSVTFSQCLSSSSPSDPFLPVKSSPIKAQRLPRHKANRKVHRVAAQHGASNISPPNRRVDLFEKHSNHFAVAQPQTFTKAKPQRYLLNNRVMYSAGFAHQVSQPDQSQQNEYQNPSWNRSPQTTSPAHLEDAVAVNEDGSVSPTSNSSASPSRSSQWAQGHLARGSAHRQRKEVFSKLSHQRQTGSVAHRSTDYPRRNPLGYIDVASSLQTHMLVSNPPLISPILPGSRKVRRGQQQILQRPKKNAAHSIRPKSSHVSKSSPFTAARRAIGGSYISDLVGTPASWNPVSSEPPTFDANSLFPVVDRPPSANNLHSHTRAVPTFSPSHRPPSAKRWHDEYKHSSRPPSARHNYPRQRAPSAGPRTPTRQRALGQSHRPPSAGARSISRPRTAAKMFPAI